MVKNHKSNGRLFLINFQSCFKIFKNLCIKKLWQDSMTRQKLQIAGKNSWLIWIQEMSYWLLGVNLRNANRKLKRDQELKQKEALLKVKLLWQVKLKLYVFLWLTNLLRAKIVSIVVSQPRWECIGADLIDCRSV
jgi:hypothetical protein